MVFYLIPFCQIVCVFSKIGFTLLYVRDNGIDVLPL
jgi:hypothetical protein